MGLTGLEPVTLRLSSACSNQLSYRPGIAAAPRNFRIRLPLFDLEQLARFARIYLNRQSQIANRKCNTKMSAFATAPARQPKRFRGWRQGDYAPASASETGPDCGFCLHAFQALEARGFEPLTSSLQSWRSTN